MIMKEQCCHIDCEEDARYMILPVQPDLSTYACVGHFLGIRTEKDSAFDLLEAVEVEFNHESDCNLHNELAYPAEACNCSARKPV